VTAFRIRAVASLDEPGLVPALAALLVACVEGGASVSFLSPLSPARAEAFWRLLGPDVASGARALLVAEEVSGRLLGTVQLALEQPENQPHRADLCKMLVDPAARRRGIGAALMQAAEAAARQAGKSLLVLDTAEGSDAERLYRRLGWQPVGRIPGYALLPDGTACATSILFKPLG